MEKKTVACGSAYRDYPFLLLPTSQDLIHWFMFVGVRIRVSKYDVDYGVSLDFP